jgi:hypothetical protein
MDQVTKAICGLLLVCFGLGVGFSLGMGNYNGLLGSILPGIIFGVIISIPFLKQHLYLAVAVLIACSLVGSMLASLTSDDFRFKKICREQHLLQLSIFSYQLGTPRPHEDTDDQH